MENNDATSVTATVGGNGNGDGSLHHNDATLTSTTTTTAQNDNNNNNDSSASSQLVERLDSDCSELAPPVHPGAVAAKAEEDDYKKKMASITSSTTTGAGLPATTTMTAAATSQQQQNNLTSSLISQGGSAPTNLTSSLLSTNMMDMDEEPRWEDEDDDDEEREVRRKIAAADAATRAKGGRANNSNDNSNALNASTTSQSSTEHIGIVDLTANNNHLNETTMRAEGCELEEITEEGMSVDNRPSDSSTKRGDGDSNAAAAIPNEASHGIHSSPDPQLSSVATLPSDTAIQHGSGIGGPTPVQFYSVEAVAVPMTDSESSEDEDSEDEVDVERGVTGAEAACAPATDGFETQLPTSQESTRSTVYNAVLVRAWYKDPKKLACLALLLGLVGAAVAMSVTMAPSPKPAPVPGIGGTVSPTPATVKPPTEPTVTVPATDGPTTFPTTSPTSSPTKRPPPPPLHSISSITQLQSFFEQECTNTNGETEKCWPYIEIKKGLGEREEEVEVVVAPLTINPNNGEALVNITWSKEIHVFRKVVVNGTDDGIITDAITGEDGNVNETIAGSAISLFEGYASENSIAVNGMRDGSTTSLFNNDTTELNGNTTANGNATNVTTTKETTPSSYFELVQVINTTYNNKPFQAGDLDIYGNYMAVGSGWENLETGAVYMYERNLMEDGEGGMTWEQVQRISPSDIDVDTEFGFDVELYDDVLVIGALQDREGKIGSAYIYRRNPDSGIWEFEHKLAPPNDEGKIFNFGMVIAIKGNRIAVGDRSYGLDRDVKPPRKGAVWLYEYDPLIKEWTQPFGDVMTSELCDNWFGVMLAFTYDDGLLVGCAQDDSRAGSVHYYEPSETGYVFRQTIIASDREKNDLFGNLEGISVYGNVLVVGLDPMKATKGKVYVFLRKDGVWVEESIIEPPSEESRKFGNMVRLSGNNIIVSSWHNAYFYELSEGEDSSAESCIISKAEGAIYDEDCTTCVKGPFAALDGDYAMVSKDKESLQILSGDDLNNVELDKGITTERFGGVALSGTAAVAGVPNENGNNGKVDLYQYEVACSCWWGPWPLYPNDIIEKAHFGTSVGIDSDVIIVGAYDYIDKSGSAYIFRYDEMNYPWPYWGQEENLLPKNDTNLQGFGQAVSIIGNTAVIGDRTYKGTTGAVFFYEYDPSSMSWMQMYEPITNADCDEHFGASLALTREGGLLIGCPGEQTKTGAVYYYFRLMAGTPFKLQQKIQSSDGTFNEQFGGPDQVAVDGDLMVVSTEQVDNGKVHVFSKTNGNAWIEVDTIRSPPDVTYFGLNVAVSDRKVLVSSAHNVYSYKIDDVCEVEDGLLR